MAWRALRRLRERALLPNLVAHPCEAANVEYSMEAGRRLSEVSGACNVAFVEDIAVDYDDVWRIHPDGSGQRLIYAPIAPPNVNPMPSERSEDVGVGHKEYAQAITAGILTKMMLTDTRLPQKNNHLQNWRWLTMRCRCDSRHACGL